eukprot:m.43646 g.43646  ORF g.43646 m.43646 type:complete len:486 (-) comp7121_c0_seq2:663-2120(-)
MDLGGWGDTFGLGVTVGTGEDTTVNFSKVNDIQASHVACGNSHSLVVDGEGYVLSCGSNDLGQLGYGKTGNIETNGDMVVFQKFHPVRCDDGSRVMGELVAVGDGFSIILDKHHCLYTFGNGVYCGHGSNFMDAIISIPRPVKMFASIHIRMVACGSHHTLALSMEGKVYSWGENSCGQLGNGEPEDVFSPMPVTDLLGKAVKKVAAGAKHSMVLTYGMDVFSFGDNTMGQLGHGDLRNRIRPELIRTLDGKQVWDVCCGDAHNLARTRSGHLYAWGSNIEGQCSFEGETRQSNKPLEVYRVFEEGRIVYSSCGRAHSVCVVKTKNDLVVLAFGANESKQLGLSKDHPAYTRPALFHPVRVHALDNLTIEMIVAGGNKTYALYHNSATKSDTDPHISLTARTAAHKASVSTEVDVVNEFASPSVSHHPSPRSSIVIERKRSSSSTSSSERSRSPKLAKLRGNSRISPLNEDDEDEDGDEDEDAMV